MIRLLFFFLTTFIVVVSLILNFPYLYLSLAQSDKSDQGAYSYAGNQGTSYANPHAATSIGGINLSYDNNGNLTSFGGNTQTWDWKNRMTLANNSRNITSYVYDHTEQRVKKTAGGVATIFPNRYFEKEGNTVTRRIYDNNGGLIASIEANGTATSTYYIHPDHLGGTNVVTDSFPSVFEVTDYLPFGKIRLEEQAGSSKEKKKFTGHDYDEDSELTYAKARYYDQDIGRFLSQDSIASRFNTNLPEVQLMLANPQLQNTYKRIYCILMQVSQ